MNNQSSIDFLIECMAIHLTHEQQMQFEGLFQQVQQMHKEEIVEAYDKGEFNQGCNGNAKQYYQETYGGQNEC
jgi:hypothetical protein